MPSISFAANALWLLVIGLFGPLVPSLIADFQISYSEAGLIFTFLSAGALIGSFVSSALSDRLHRKRLWLALTALLTAGLLLTGSAGRYRYLLGSVFVMSLFGGSVGPVGQSIMLAMFPEKRGRYLSLQTMWAAAGSLAAPFAAAAALALFGGWRYGFYAAAAATLLLCLGIFAVQLPGKAQGGGDRIPLRRIAGDREVIRAGLLIFLSVGIDIGFSYWLTEYLIISAGADEAAAGLAVSVYLAGGAAGRFSLARLSVKGGRRLIIAGPAAAAVSLALMLQVPGIVMKLLCCLLYGAGTGPLFPSLLSAGTARYPESSGAVTGVLFAMMSAAGMAFPLFVGIIGTRFGIEGAYITLALITLMIIPGLLRISRAD